MQKKIQQQLVLGTILMGCFLSLTVLAASTAVTGNVTQTLHGLANANSAAGYSAPTTSIYTIVANIINVILGLSGIAFVGLIIWSGLQFFISQGNPDRIKSAKSTLVWASIGLVIIVAAYAGTLFLFNKLLPVLGSASSTS